MHPNIRNSHNFKILLIGGIDSSGGSGLQRDLEFQRNDENLRIIPSFYSSQGESSSLSCVDKDFFIKCVDDLLNIWCCERVLIKVGAVAEKWQLEKIKEFKISLDHCFLLFDPVLSSSRGQTFVTNEALTFIREEFLDCVDLLTPNMDEFKNIYLVDENIDSFEIYKKVEELNLKNILLKGGHHKLHLDYFSGLNDCFYLKTEYLKNSYRGTGCALGSLIIRGLSDGLNLEDSVVWAKGALYQSLENSKSYIKFENNLLTLPKLYKSLELRNYAFKKLSSHRTKLYPIVSNFLELEEIINTGIEIIQLRIKNLSPFDLRSLVIRCQILCKKRNVLLFLNDYWELAIELKLDGVHLGYEDIQKSDLARIESAGLLLGVSSHSYLEGAFMKAINPSYIALGPINETTLKKMDFSSQGVRALRNWIDLFDIPVVAIGGITLANCDEILRENPAFICAVQDIVCHESPRLRSIDWMNKIEDICVQ